MSESCNCTSNTIPPCATNRYCWFQETAPSSPAGSAPICLVSATAPIHILHATLIDADTSSLYGERANYGSDNNTNGVVLARGYVGDSGFDLYVPADITVAPGETATIDHRIVCEPQFTGGYYLYPRSSISKTPLRLANSVGIIDNGYRGSIMAKVDNRGTEPYTIKRGERLFQLCHPSLQPLTVRLVTAVDVHTERGTGGFGSTTK